MAARLFSDVVSGNSLNDHDKGTSSNNENEEKQLWDKIHKLKEYSIHNYPNGLKSDIEWINEKAKSVRQNIDQDRETKQKEIKELEKRVSSLEEDIKTWKKRVSDLEHMNVKRLQRNVGTIDAGEAIKIIENHAALFVLPRKTKIAGADGFGQIMKYEAKNPSQDPKPRSPWDLLQNQCGMITWTDDHTKAKNNLITYRNNDAHHKKFDLPQLLEAMINLLPHQEEHCKQFVLLFEKVDSLLKFGVLASELVNRDDISKPDKDFLRKIANECYRDVQYLQDIKLEEAKEHLVQYFTERHVSTFRLDNVTSVIRETNRPRLGMLVKENEMEIVAWILKDQTKQTFGFDEMNSFLARGERSSREQAKRWNKLADGKKWGKDHSKAMTELKNLLPDNHFETRDDPPLSLRSAKLHIPDFLHKDLWDAGSDILEIFCRREEEKINMSR